MQAHLSIIEIYLMVSINFSNIKIHLSLQIIVNIRTFLVTPSYLYLLLALTVVGYVALMVISA